MVWLFVSIAVVFVLAARLFVGYPPRPEGLRVLNNREAALVAAAAEAMFPRGGAIAESGVDAGVVAYFDDQIDHITQKNRRLIRLLLVFIELFPVFFSRYARRFTRLSVEQQMRVLAAAGESRQYFFRLTFLSLRSLLCLGYFANAHVNAQLESTPNARPFAP